MNEQDALTHEPMRPVVFFPHEKHVVKTIIREGISYIEERKETYYQSDNNQFNNHGNNIAVGTTNYKNEQSLIWLLF